MMAAGNSPSKEQPENGGLPSKSKRRPKPFATRDFPKNCGPSKLHTASDSPVKCTPVIEGSPATVPEKSCILSSGTKGGRTEGFKDMEKPKILDDIAEEMGGEDEQKLGSLEAVRENAVERTVEEEGVLSNSLFKCVDGQYFGEKVSEIGEEGGVDMNLERVQEKNNTGLEENFGEGGANMNLKRVQEKSSSGSEMEWDDLGDEYMETEGEGEGVVGKILSRSFDGQNLDEIFSENGREGGADMNLRSVREKDNTGLELTWEDLGDDIYVLSSQDVKNHAKFDGDGGDVVGSQGTEMIILEDYDSDGNVSVSEKKGKKCRRNWREPEFLELDQYEVEREQDESMENFTTCDNLACVEFKDTCNDQPKTYQTLEELVNLCIVKHDQPGGYKVREALMKFEEHFKAVEKDRKERKAEMGEEQKGKKHAHMEAAERVKAKGKCISVRKPFGHIPGIEIGDTFRYRVQLAVVGLHRQIMSGIDYVTIGDKKLATCVVDSGRYENEAKANDSLIYSGQGWNPKSSEKAADQKLEKGNLAMVNSMEMGFPVRVITKRMSGTASHVFGHSDDSKFSYAYDGLYTVTKYWQARDKNGSLVFKFELIRMPGQPRPRQTVAKSGKLLPRKEICIKNDMSLGLENRPIRAMNGIDDLRPPPFTYINKIIYLDSYRCVEPVGCDCINGCLDSHQCPCVVRNGGQIPFNEKGLIVRSRPIVYECGPNCKCPPSCMNRVSQHGLRIQLEIFKTKERGWGLRTRGYVTSGSFICEYIGELLQEKEAEQRIGEDEYLFDIGDDHGEDGEFEGLVDSRNHDLFAIDAGKFGNVGRFVNHSCSPNMFAQEVLYDHHDKKMPHIMFFATKNIPASHELTYNYNYKIDRVYDVNGNIKKKPCFCGSSNCNGRMY
ncbi:histone-lysine N-methyltransferase, H3 lysine-9 specific SUVH5-like [Primulina eburnea]|uniref:histone-lysine N-methyltransferase, H3 lysine-9 specific SUVH5-like n=1 Tax=Primulina eburnea TaxID=1245227 RepID=UPI003C6C77D2